jgi:hypothetical protein
MSMTIKDELSPNFIEQPGASMHVAIMGSGLGEGLCFEFYDEMENELDSVFIQDKKVITNLRDFLNEVLEREFQE